MNRGRFRLLVVVAVLCLVTIGVFIALPSKHSQPKSVATAASQSKTVQLSNIGAFKTWLNSSSANTIGTALYGQLTNYINRPSSTYQGTIRPESFKTTYSEYDNGTDPPTSVPTVQYIVDIPAAQESYLVTESGGSGYPYNILHIDCPAKNQLRYGDFGCVNEEQ